MGAYDSCRLIHQNLTSYVINPFTDEASIDETLLYQHSYETMLLADDLVDLEIEAIDRILSVVEDSKEEFELWSKIANIAGRGRRAGVGFTGLADTLAMLNVNYNDSAATVHKIMRIIYKAQLDCQIDMAIERGAFPSWDKDLEESSNLFWYRNLASNNPEIANRMYKYGRRNISWSTVAPTGTVSILAGTSSGIEPVFMPVYQRKKKCMSDKDRVDYTDVKGEKYTLFTVVHPGLSKWAISNTSWNSIPIGDWTLEEWEDACKRSPYKECSAHEINWESRIEIQGAVQQYITHSISSTINLPSHYNKHNISDIYMEAWLQGLKGVTIYRDGCREGVLTSTNTEKRSAPKRPKDLEADCYMVKSRGEQYLVLVGLLDGKPYEIFTIRPKNEVNVPIHKGKITKKGKMRYIFNSDYISIDILYASNISVEEKAATLYASMLLRHGVDIKYIVKTAKKVNDNIVSFSSAMCRVLSKYIGSEKVENEVCPDCGSSLVRENGCTHCKNCGYSKCS